MRRTSLRNSGNFDMFTGRCIDSTQNYYTNCHKQRVNVEESFRQQSKKYQCLFSNHLQASPPAGPIQLFDSWKATCFLLHSYLKMLSRTAVESPLASSFI